MRGEDPVAPPKDDMAATTPDEEIVRASGFCIVCDFRFTDEVVLRFREPALPGGWGYVETRHLDADELQRFGASAPSSSPSRSMSDD